MCAGFLSSKNNCLLKIEITNDVGIDFFGDGNTREEVIAFLKIRARGEGKTGRRKIVHKQPGKHL